MLKRLRWEWQMWRDRRASDRVDWKQNQNALHRAHERITSIETALTHKINRLEARVEMLETAARTRAGWPDESDRDPKRNGPAPTKR